MGNKILLTFAGKKLFELTKDYSINQINAVQSIAYEPSITEQNFTEITELPTSTLNDLIKNRLIIIAD